MNYFGSETTGGVFVCDVGVVQKCTIKDHEIFQISGQCFPTGQTGSERKAGFTWTQTGELHGQRGFFYLPYFQIHLFIRVTCLNALMLTNVDRNITVWWSEA